MDNNITSRIYGEVYDKSYTYLPFTGKLTYRDAEYISPDNYSPLSEPKDGALGMELPNARTLFFEAEMDIPAEIKAGGYETFICFSTDHREGLLSVNGEVYQGLDGNRSRIPIRAEWAGTKIKLEFMIYTRDRRRAFLDRFGLIKVDTAIDSFCRLFTLANEYALMDEQQGESDNKNIRVRVSKAVEDCVAGLDVELCGEELRAACVKANGILASRLAEIDDGDVRGLVSFIGHTHIDVAWLWQLKDTVRKTGHSFANVLRLMDEYPDFTFTCSQLRLLDYAKTYYPTLFEQIKKRVADGRWEIVGPMWVESDCNVTSGESLVRQILFGVNFSEKEFGTRSHVAWLPDTFGFQPNLPQIFKKSGTDSFYTYKLHWQHQNRFPYGVFRWEGIDGSEVVVSCANNPGAYNGDPTASQLRRARQENLQNGEMDNVIFPYGWGDGGGGPTRDQVENAELLTDFPGLPKAVFERADEYFDRFADKKSELPKWFGELYIETHRGTLSSQGRNKRKNRRAEIAYQNAEKLGSVAMLAGLKPDFAPLADGWKDILTLQFHDILPGSSINDVYAKDSVEGYGRALTAVESFTKSITDKVAGSSFAVFNFLSWQRDAVCEITLKSVPEGAALCEADGKAVPCEITDCEGGKKLTFVAKNLPSLGGRVYSLRAPKPFPLHLGKAPAPASAVSEADGSICLDTGAMRVEIDSLGRLARLYDKKAEREALSAPANDLCMFYDGPQDEDAWNIYDTYMKRPVELDWQVSLKVTENSPIRTVVHVEKSVDKCAIHQDIVIYPDKTVVEFKTKIDWSIRHRVLRAYFPANVRSQYCAYEVGFGTFLRPTVANTSFDKSRFEVSAHRFADLSEGSYGLSVLNDCKYGHNCIDNTIGVTLLRGTTAPDPLADIGEHEINYAVFAHEGDWREALTPRMGQEFNNAPAVFAVDERAVRELDGASFASATSEDIIIDTVKPAEDGNGFIVRAYECRGNRGSAAIVFGRAPSSACETDLVEKKLGDAKLNGKSIDFDYTPYEIITYRVNF